MAQDQTTQAAMYCRKCSYQLVGLSEKRCPECGRPFDLANARSFSLYERGYLLRRWLRRIVWTSSIVLGCAILLLGGAAAWFYWGWRSEQPALVAVDQLGHRLIQTAPVRIPLGTLYREANQSDSPPFLLRSVPTVLHEGFAEGPSWLVRLVQGIDIGSPYTSSPTWQRPVLYGGLFNGRFAWLLQRTSRILIQNVLVDDADLAHLQRFACLRKLELPGTNISDERLRHLEGLPNLTSLDLSGTQITDTGLLRLRSLRSLHELDVTGTQVTPEGIRQLKGYLPNTNVRGPLAQKYSYDPVPPGPAVPE